MLKHGPMNILFDSVGGQGVVLTVYIMMENNIWLKNKFVGLIWLLNFHLLA
jgi:hypothetical protein